MKFFEKSDLCEELKDHLYFDEKIKCFAIKHPLVMSIFYSNELASFYNKQLVQKKKSIERSLQKGKYEWACTMYEKPFRVNFIYKYRHKIPCETYWPLLRETWMTTEFPFQTTKKWIDLFEMRKSRKDLFMTESDKAKLEEMDDEITVYRGYQSPEYEKGMSYTLSYETAEFFNFFNFTHNYLHRDLYKKNFQRVFRQTVL